MAEKKRTRKSFAFYGINFRLHSSTRKASEALPAIFENIRRKKIWKAVFGDTCLIIRNIWEISDSEDALYAGYFTKFTRISGVWFNLEALDSEKVEIPKNKYPNFKDCDFFMIPHLHRIFVKRTAGVSLKLVLHYLEEVIPEQLHHGENIQIYMEKSEALIAKILNARAVRRLSIDITYSNDDDFDDYIKEMDESLKNGRVGRTQMVFVPDASENLLVKESSVIYGLMGLANSNGELDSTIINEEGKKEKIRSNKFPRIFPVISENKDMLPYKLLSSVKGIFRRAR